jgi:hypothetical protein
MPGTRESSPRRVASTIGIPALSLTVGVLKGKAESICSYRVLLSGPVADLTQWPRRLKQVFPLKEALIAGARLRAAVFSLQAEADSHTAYVG